MRKTERAQTPICAVLLPSHARVRLCLLPGKVVYRSIGRLPGPLRLVLGRHGWANDAVATMARMITGSLPGDESRRARADVKSRSCIAPLSKTAGPGVRTLMGGFYLHFYYFSFLVWFGLGLPLLSLVRICRGPVASRHINQLRAREKMVFLLFPPPHIRPPALITFLLWFVFCVSFIHFYFYF